MPNEKDLKRRVRARMRKTGESYTTARAQLVRKQGRSGDSEPSSGPPPAEYAAIAEVSDASVRSKTGKDWAGWVRALDAVDAAARSHRDIAKHLREEHGVASWWSQQVTVGYERIRGLRAKGQQRGGTYDVNKSKTVPVPVDALYRAFGARSRRRWLGDVGWKVRTAQPGKSMRVTWEEDGTPLDLYFLSKGPAKSQVSLQHRQQPTKARADEVRAFWSEKLAALAEQLRRA